jgi:DNA-binding MarR family transcriptional regulator
LSQFGITGSQCGVLLTLHRAEAEENQPALRLTDLGDRLLVRPPSVTGVVERLHRLGLLNREPSSEDARAKLVSLTATGRGLTRQVFQWLPGHVENVLSDLSCSDRQELRRLLELISNRLETMDLTSGKHPNHTPSYATADSQADEA